MTSPEARIFWDDRFLAYDLGESHPFQEEYRRLAVRLVELQPSPGPPASTRVDFVRTFEPAARADLERFHRPDYLAFVEAAGRRSARIPLDAGDTPSFPNCLQESARLVEATVEAMEFVRSEPGRRGVQLGGGLHHAYPGRASGFCVLNDAAVGLARLFATGTRRAAYIDIDAHHGDGVMYGFYDDGRLLDIDFHQDGRTIFPGTGRLEETGRGDGSGLKVNVPLPPGVGDEALVPLFERVVPAMLREFRPELIVLQHGVDGHVGDSLGATALQYTSKSYATVVNRLLELSTEVAGGRFVLLGGGGYLAESVSRVLAQAAGWVAGIDVAGWDLPAERWRREFESSVGRAAPTDWRPPIEPDPSPWTAEKTERLVGSLARSLGRVFPSTR